MNSVMMFWQYRISLFFLLGFLLIFLPLRKNKGLIGLCMMGCFGITGVMDYLFFIAGNYENPVFHTLAEIVVIQTVPFVICKYRDFRAMFVGFTGAVYVLAGNIACTMLYIVGADLAVNLICQCVIHSLLLGILVWRIRGSFLDSLDNAELQWGQLCLIPALFYTAVYATSMWPANIYRQPENLLGVCSIMALMVVSYIMIIQIFTKMKQEGERKRSVAYLENYANRLKYEADLIQEKEMQAAVIRHDLKHYSILINSYLGEGREEEIRQLLKELNEHVNETKSVRYCENLAVNGIVAHCARQAKKKELRFDADMEIPQKMRVNEFEFATVVSNLLENAVNAASAAEKEAYRFVKISARGVKDKLILHIENGCREEPEISKVTGLPVSKGGVQHGYGMQSVLAFVRKNEAIFDFSVKDNVFSVKILFRI